MDSDHKNVSTSTCSAANVSAMSVKLPDFYATDPASWCLSAKAQFGLRAVFSDDTKYWYILSALDMETSACAVRAVSNIPPRKKYSTLKRLLLKAFFLSRWEHTTNLGD